MWYDQLRGDLKAGDHVMTVEGLTAPLSLGGAYEPIGKVTLISDLYTSVFGDQRFHFQHLRINVDRKYWERKWKQEKEDLEFQINRNNRFGTGEKSLEGKWPETDEEAKEMYEAQIQEFGCPFAWILD